MFRPLEYWARMAVPVYGPMVLVVTCTPVEPPSTLMPRCEASTLFDTTELTPAVTDTPQMLMLCIVLLLISVSPPLVVMPFSPTSCMMLFCTVMNEFSAFTASPHSLRTTTADTTADEDVHVASPTFRSLMPAVGACEPPPPSSQRRIKNSCGEPEQEIAKVNFFP